MCMFAVRGQTAVEVGGTHIFARMDAQGRQWLAYEMSVRVPEETAMVLPVPVAPGGQGAFEFINLAGYPTLFDDLMRAVRVWGSPRLTDRITLSAGRGGPPRLAVHQVGAYEASFVPDLDAFARLDERFSLSPEVRRQLPDYGRFGFAVFKLAPTRGERPERVHAMAFRFAARERDALYFPTVHVHDGNWHEHADFNHLLYLQGGPYQLPEETIYAEGRAIAIEAVRQDAALLERAEHFERGDGRMAGEFGCMFPAAYGVLRGGAPVLHPEKSQGLIDAGEPITALGLAGRLPNADTWIRRGGQLPPLMQAALPRDWSGDMDKIEIV